MKIAIVAVAYNRVDSLKRLLSSLESANYYGDKVDLIISVDKSNTDVVENFSDSYKWEHGSKIVDKHSSNLGLRNHMLSLGKWFDKYDALVILEDDIIVCPNFFSYTKQTVNKYHTCSDIAGISLYGFSINYHKGVPFSPIKDEYDIYFMKCAMSWGEVWLKDSWKRFYSWYLENKDFSEDPSLPRSLFGWGEKSWLKYHTRFCIENNLYFVHPYVSLSTNFSEAGVHQNRSGSTVHQVEMQFGEKKEYLLPEYKNEGQYYDGFFENEALYKHLGLSKEELCVDLYSEKSNKPHKRYWLTTTSQNYKIVKSFGLNYRPIEVNVIFNNPGDEIYLYDTSIIQKNPLVDTRTYLLYPYHLRNIILFIKSYTLKNTLADLKDLIINKYYKKIL